MPIILALRRSRQEYFVQVQSQPGLHNEFQDSLDYLGRPYFKRKKERKGGIRERRKEDS